MLLFRFICALLMAWAINVALSRPEAILLVEEAPELDVIGPLCAAFIGFINLAKRQGWGMIVAVANGIWAGILTILMAIFSFLMVITVIGNSRAIGDYNDFARIFGSAAEPLLASLADVPLLVVIFTATAVVGILTEILHWCLVRMLRGRGESS